MIRKILGVVTALAIAVPSFAQPSPVDRIVRSKSFKTAAAALDAGHDGWVADVIAITEIPSPPFKEEVRAKAFADMLRSRGLPVEIDAEGNVLALRKGTEGGPVVVVAAHLDTVFPEGTDVKVRREGDKLYAPGVSDDSSGLATILALVDAIEAGKIRTRRDILFVGNVGEEGPGNLRGVRHLFEKGAYKGRIGAFFSLDTSGLENFINEGTGSQRYRIAFKGPGGHSYGAFGIVNPMVALAATVTDLYRIPVPAKPKTTFSASVVGGGTSVNSIPYETWLEVDMRSESPAELAKLEKEFLAIVERSVAAENAARNVASGKVTAEVKLTGSRPAGRTGEGEPIVRDTIAAYRAEGIDVSRKAGSTDANLPMNLGIPAVTLSTIAEGYHAHALDERADVSKAPNLKIKRIALAAILAAAGLR